MGAGFEECLSKKKLYEDEDEFVSVGKNIRFSSEEFFTKEMKNKLFRKFKPIKYSDLFVVKKKYKDEDGNMTFYYGEVIDDEPSEKPHGRGIMLINKHVSYEGYWRNGILNGKINLLESEQESEDDLRTLYKGFDKDLVKNIYHDEDIEQDIANVLIKQLEKKYSKSNYESIKQKCYRKLTYNGFENNVINNAIKLLDGKLFVNEMNSLRNDLKIAKRKYLNKCSSKDFSSNVVKYLLSKGYRYSDIELIKGEIQNDRYCNEKENTHIQGKGEGCHIYPRCC